MADLITGRPGDPSAPRRTHPGAAQPSAGRRRLPPPWRLAHVDTLAAADELQRLLASGEVDDPFQEWTRPALYQHPPVWYNIIVLFVGDAWRRMEPEG